MQRVYQWKYNLKVKHSDDSGTICGKLVFKTKDTSWLNTSEPIIIAVSPYSAFHEGVNGDLKMNALIATIKAHVQSPISILIADEAHMETLRLKYFERAQEEAKKTANRLYCRYSDHFKGCNVYYYHSLIRNDKRFSSILAKLHDLAQKDHRFNELLLWDAVGTYTDARGNEFPDKKLFVEKAVLDIIDQSACLLVLAEQGYRFQFYPGPSFTATEYVNQILLPLEKQILWVHVFLSIQSKSKLQS